MQERQQVTLHCRAGMQNQNHQDLDLDDGKQDLEVAHLHQLGGMPPGREVLINRRPQNHFDHLLPFRGCRHIRRHFPFLLISLADSRPF